jgi:uncharacterized protein (TIGR03437 family)
VSVSVSPKLVITLGVLLLAASADGYTCTNAAAPNITFIDSASAYGGYSYFTSGSWLEIKGSNLADPNDPRIASGTGQWAQSDFIGANAPTALDGISATVDGKPAYIAYISPGQINVQAPQDSATGLIMVTVTNCHATSSAIAFTKQSLAPGLLAPPNYSANGKQYLVATFVSDAAYVLSTNIGQSFGLNSRPAKPGDLIVAYGVGFGPVSPAIAPGIIVTTNNSLTNPVTISFGSTPATVTYAGLVPEFVGLYEFYITVPQGLANGDYPIIMTQNSVQLPQATYYLTVGSSGSGGATPMVQSLMLSSSSVAGGTGVTGTVTLTAPAPAGGAAVTLASNSAAAAAPSSVTVPAGGISATFNITTSAVNSNTNATVTATYGGTSASAILAVTASKGGGGTLPPFNLMSVTPSITSSNQSSLTFSFDVGGAGCAASGNTLGFGDQSGFTFGAVWSGYTLSGDTITCTGFQSSDPNSAMTYTTGQSAQWTSATLTFTLSPQNNFSGTVASGTLKLSSSLATVNASFTGTYETE